MGAPAMSRATHVGPGHWSDLFIGRPYVEGEFDCASLAVAVREEVFGQSIALPADHGDGPFARSATIARHQADYAERVTVPRDGDAVLLRVRNRAQHIGVFCEFGRENWVLHNQKPTGVHRTRLRDLERYGYQVEGFYRWK